MDTQKPVIPPRSKMDLISEAVDVLRRSENFLSPEEMLELAEKLKIVKAFNYARRILARAADDSTLKQGALKLKIYQQWSLCTYKDSDLPADARLDKALDILCEMEDLATTTNQETLGIAGAIYKRKWEIDNQRLQLERSLLYYERGYRQGVANDWGYTAINAAFVLDLLAYQEEEAAKKINSTSEIAEKRKIQAGLIREDIVKTVAPLFPEPETECVPKMWWFYSTVAEAYFGLKQYAKAVEWLKPCQEKIGEIPDWERETTLTQLARLAILQSGSSETGDDFPNSLPRNALYEAFGHNAEAVRTAFIGKIGLALSGGGFRASLFHIGMLAKLAELDVLRRVEVLSCVSGGSIVGAHYYLEVRKLLQNKPDAEITQQDYIKIVENIEKDFLAGVQRNVRMRIAAELLTNLKMIFLPGYSRSLRAGELYEEEIFSRVKDGEGNKERYLNELNISPEGEAENFSPKLHNWRRTAKAPILILNATTLNTGHNWQFTTTWMGEPPSSIDVEVDTNDLFRRMYYSEAPKEHRKIRLGHAVSASAAVPGVFEPLSLVNLYPDRVVRLADGGGTDNQGLGGLLEQDCTVVLVSDGSGQMESQNTPSGGIFGVLLRSSSILQSRIRDVQYHDLERRKRSSLLRGLMFIHLKDDLDTDPINWIDCLDPFESGIDARPASERGVLTSYGIAKKMQTLLAAIRTDLDSFTDVEAYTLMTSGYKMTEYAFVRRKCVDGFPDKGEKGNWKFLEVENDMKGAGDKYKYALRLLGTSDSIAFKVWRQSPALKYFAGFLILAAVALIVWWCYTSSQLPLVNITVGTAGKWILSLFVIAVATHFFGWLVKVVRWRETLFRLLFGAVMSIFGWLVARLHLHVFDKLFLRRGSIESLRNSDSKDSPPKSGTRLKLLGIGLILFGLALPVATGYYYNRTPEEESGEIHKKLKIGDSEIPLGTPLGVMITAPLTIVGGLALSFGLINKSESLFHRLNRSASKFLSLGADDDTSEEVQCTLYVPAEARAGDDFLVQVFAHLAVQADALGALAKAADEKAEQQTVRTLGKLIGRGKRLTFELWLPPEFTIDEPIQSHIWNGKIVEVPFIVSVPKIHESGNRRGKIIVSENDVPVGRLDFEIEIANAGTQMVKTRKVLRSKLKRYRRAFISYSSDDRPKVSPRVQAWEAANIECFQDVLSLKPGEKWAEKLYEFIDRSDVFFLFWSSSARKSSEVDKEISYALERQKKTKDESPDIIPIVIEGPPIVPPTDKLKSLHFNDRHAYFGYAVEAEAEAKNAQGKFGRNK